MSFDNTVTVHEHKYFNEKLLL